MVDSSKPLVVVKVRWGGGSHGMDFCFRQGHVEALLTGRGVEKLEYFLYLLRALRPKKEVINEGES